MFEYEIAEIRRAELIQEAEAARLVRQVRRSRRAARRSAKDGEGAVSRLAERFVRAA